MSLEVTDTVLEPAKALNASDDVANAYRVRAEVGDNSLLISTVIVH